MRRAALLFVLVGCGVTFEPSPEAGSDAAIDVAPDVVLDAATADVTADAGADVSDGGANVCIVGDASYLCDEAGAAWRYVDPDSGTSMQCNAGTCAPGEQCITSGGWLGQCQ